MYSTIPGNRWCNVPLWNGKDNCHPPLQLLEDLGCVFPVSCIDSISKKTWRGGLSSSQSSFASARCLCFFRFSFFSLASSSGDLGIWIKHWWGAASIYLWQEGNCVKPHSCSVCSRRPNNNYLQAWYFRRWVETLMFSESAVYPL